MTPESKPPEPPPNHKEEPQVTEGRILSLINVVKGLTLSNVLVIVVLITVLVPVYVIYRAINDEQLMDRFLSDFRELGSQQTGCTVRAARPRGGTLVYGISAGFAFQGSDRYLISVALDHPPTPQEVASYCDVLNLIIDYMRDPEGTSPEFPGTNDPIIRTYAPKKE